MKKLFRFLLFGFIIFMAIGYFSEENLETDYNEEETTYNENEEEETNHEENLNNENEEEENNTSDNNENLAENKTLMPCETSQKKTAHQASWKDYNSRPFQASIKVVPRDACKSNQNRENLPTPYYDGSNDAAYWQEVYNHLFKGDNSRLKEIYRDLKNASGNKKLNTQSFAEMVVCFIQSIPYVLVHEGTCEQDKEWGGFSVSYHNEGHECLPNIRYGLQSPLEFMYNFKGDCDTRAVTAYALLSYFGYDVVVLGCAAHAMLGINLPGNGMYLKYKGKKYYFWETTNVGWQIGQVPPDYKNANWYVYLPSQNDM